MDDLKHLFCIYLKKTFSIVYYLIIQRQAACGCEGLVLARPCLVAACGTFYCTPFFLDFFFTSTLYSRKYSCADWLSKIFFSLENSTLGGVLIILKSLSHTQLRIPTGVPSPLKCSASSAANICNGIFTSAPQNQDSVKKGTQKKSTRSSKKKYIYIYCNRILLAPTVGQPLLRGCI